MRKAYTLLELLVVVALMGMMATLAVGSYSAITRGSRERAALSVARATADAAVQRANMDRTKIYLFLFDEVTQTESSTERGNGSGVMIAVRPIGRITQVPQSDLYCDEFSDINKIYGSLDDTTGGSNAGEQEESASTFRLYNITRKSYTAVLEGTSSFDITDDDLEDAEGSDRRTWTIYGFRRVDGDGDGTFQVGDLYGQEFSVTRLPPGYFFGNSVQMSGSQDLGQKLVRIVEITSLQTETPSVQIYARRPDGGYQSIGDIKDSKDGKEGQ